MSKRLQLHEILVEVVGSRNVYFQPPETVKMDYPCIVYSRREVNFNTLFANGLIYGFRKAYQATLIDPNPDSEIPDKLMLLPYCRFERHFTKDNLNHDVYRLFY